MRPFPARFQFPIASLIAAIYIRPEHFDAQFSGELAVRHIRQKTDQTTNQRLETWEDHPAAHSICQRFVFDTVKFIIKSPSAENRFYSQCSSIIISFAKLVDNFFRPWIVFLDMCVGHSRFRLSVRQASNNSILIYERSMHSQARNGRFGCQLMNSHFSESYM